MSSSPALGSELTVQSVLEILSLSLLLSLSLSASSSLSLFGTEVPKGCSGIKSGNLLPYCVFCFDLEDVWCGPAEGWAER